MKFCIHLPPAIVLLFGLNHAMGQSFVLSGTYPVSQPPYSVVAADINGDGKLDLVSANTDSTYNNLMAFTNKGDGTFRVCSTNYSGASPYQVVAADFNGDGKMDVAAANNYYDKTLGVLTNNGAGKFTLSTTIPMPSTYGPRWLATGDVNGDGWPDLIGEPLTGASSMSVFTNNGNGTFTLASSPSPPASFARGVIAVDVNRDGRVDFVTANTGDGTLSIFTNNSRGTFTLAGLPNVGVSRPVFVTAADVNGDGMVDLITANDTTNTVSILTNNGVGVFKLASMVSVGRLSTGSGSVAAGEFYGDGRMSLVNANFTDNTLTVLTNKGGGIFASNATFNVGNGPISVVTADVNGDGRLDLICADNNDKTLVVLTNTGTFKPRLAVKLSGNNVVVSWASSWTGWAGWILQQNTNLATTGWTNFSGTIGDDGTTKTATNSTVTGNKFFRLSRP